MKYYGMIGFAETVETSPDVWSEQIVEHPYYGDVLNFGSRLSGGSEINGSISVSSRISILADPYAREHFFNMRYVEWQGAKWKPADIEVRFPRLIITLGGLYNVEST